MNVGKGIKPKRVVIIDNALLADPMRATKWPPVPSTNAHQYWMALLLAVIVGKFTEWVPGITGMPLGKIAFLFTVVYTYKVRRSLVPVRVWSMPIARPAIAFLVLSIFSITFSIWKSNTLVDIQASFIYLITFILVLKITQSLADVERLLLALAASAVSLAAGVILNYGGGRGHINNSFDPNDVAYILDTLMPIVIALGVGHSSRLKWLAYGLCVLMALAVLLTGSRGGAIGFGVILAAFIVFPLALTKTGQLQPFRIGSTVFKLLVVMVLAVGIWGSLPGETKERLTTLTDLQNDYNAGHTNASRSWIWRRHIALALRRPIGYGMGSAPAADGLAGGQYRTSHNSVVQSFIELGALGLILFVSSYCLAWKQLTFLGKRAQQSGDTQGTKVALYTRSLNIALLGNLSAGFFLSQAYSACLWMTVAICAALVRVGLNDAPVAGEASAAKSARRSRSRVQRKAPV
jgi:O-antigen ligase